MAWHTTSAAQRPARFLWKPRTGLIPRDRGRTQHSLPDTDGGKPLWRDRRVVRRMANISVPQEVLDETRVGAFVCQHVAGGMPQHVRMRFNIELCQPTGLTNEQATPPFDPKNSRNQKALVQAWARGRGDRVLELAQGGWHGSTGCRRRQLQAVLKDEAAAVEARRKDADAARLSIWPCALLV